ncbi:MAG: DoxX family protein [Acidimicrobiales bacterium]
MSHINFVLLVLRVGLGVTMALHGWNKVRKGIAGTAGWFQSIGMRPGRLNALMAAYTEMGGGALLAIGLLTPVAAAAMIGLMGVAYWVAHKENGFFIFNPNQGWEYVFIIAIAALAVGGIGPGEWSLDNAIGLGNPIYTSWWGAIITLVGGIGGAVAQLATFYRPPAKD